MRTEDKVKKARKSEDQKLGSWKVEKLRENRHLFL